MRKLKWRELRNGAEVIKDLPVVLEYDGVNVAVILTLRQYNKLVRDYKQNGVKLYNPAIHKAGDQVLVKQGKKLIEAVVPELDAGGQKMPSFE